MAESEIPRSRLRGIKACMRSKLRETTAGREYRMKKEQRKYEEEYVWNGGLGLSEDGV